MYKKTAKRDKKGKVIQEVLQSFPSTSHSASHTCLSNVAIQHILPSAQEQYCNFSAFPLVNVC